MNSKEDLESLLNSIKNTTGLSQREIAIAAGYREKYLSEIRAKGVSPKKLIEKLKLIDWEKLKKTTGPKADPVDRYDIIGKLSESAHTLADSNKLMAEGQMRLIAIIEGLMQKLPTASELPGISEEQLPIFYELQNLIATAGVKGWHTEEEGLAEIGTRLHDVMEKSYAKGK